MLDITSLQITESRPHVSAFLPTGLSSMDAIWGCGLPQGGLCEIRAGDGVDLTQIARQLINSLLKRGENVAYFSIVDNPNPSPIPETGNRPQPGDDRPQGQLDVHCGSTYGYVERKLTAFENEGRCYAAIFVDVLSRNPAGCPDSSASDSVLLASPGSPKRSRDAFLRHCRKVIESLSCPLLLLERNEARSIVDTEVDEWVTHLDVDSLVDARTHILRCEEILGVEIRDGLFPQRATMAWTMRRFGNATINPVPLYMDNEGGVDEEMSLGAILIQQGVIQWRMEGFLLPDAENPVPDLEAVRDWVAANIEKVKLKVAGLTR